MHAQRAVTSDGGRWRAYEQIDAVRRWHGSVLDAMGWGAIETPSRIVLAAPGVTLKAYSEGAGSGPVVVLVPAPIKRAYIWDLSPEASVVRHCLRRGIRVFLVQWEAPPSGALGLALAEYAGEALLQCLDAVARETGVRRIFFAGHSLGGTLAAMFCALHPERVQGLAVIASPLHFGFRPDTGALGPVISLVARQRLLETVTGPIPGSFLSLLSFTASPGTFGRERWADWFASLPDANALRTHLRVERWSLDEMPLSPRFVQDVVVLLYRHDGFMQGTLSLGGRPVSPQHVAAPLLVVADARCRIVPPEAILPFHDAAASIDKKILWYEGDTGVAIQHVGMLVGKSAHERLWPEILDWIHAHRAP